ncbi:MAG: YkvA family protein [Planctomycetota bacterium]|jgi:uncharacterized membrane protein YkvA (DUF1232 family)
MDDQERVDQAVEQVRRGAEGITDRHLADLAEREAELRAIFDRPGPIGHVISDAHLMMALVRDYRDDRYREVPWWAISAVSFCLIYVVSPVDALPDLVPVIGRIDDAAVLGACLLLVDQELQKYKRWRFEQLRCGEG